MPATVEVRFKGIRKDYFRWADDDRALRLREAVIVEADRGFDLGYVSAVGELAEKKCTGCTGCAVGGGNGEAPATAGEPPAGDANGSAGPALRGVLRVAEPEERRQADELRRGEDDVRRRVAERARSHGLDMKVSDAEWQWDRKKLTIYFTAEHRVDFRALVRELAAQYHTRIELRQIGVRDEAARLGGVGRCGREYCCSSWLKELSPVSLSLAKDQHLSLNPGQISGGCGRLLCCLRYEHEFYVAQRKRFPKEGKTLRTARGPEKVVAVDIFRERVSLRGETEGPRTVLLTDLQAELEQAGAAPAPATAPAGSPAQAPPAPPRSGVSHAPEPSAAPAVEGAPESRRRRRRRRRGQDPGGGDPGGAGPRGGPPTPAPDRA